MTKEIEFIYEQNDYTLYGVRYEISEDGLDLIGCYCFDNNGGRRDIGHNAIPSVIINYIQDSLTEALIANKSFNQYYFAHVDECIDAKYNVITQVTTHIQEDSIIIEYYAQERN